MTESNPLAKIVLSVFLIAIVSVTSGCLGSSPKQSGIFVTTNNGTAWTATPDLSNKKTKAPKVYPPVEATAVAVSPQDGKFVVAGTSDKLYRTADGGAKWEELTKKLPITKKHITVQTIRFDPSQSDTYYVAGVSGGYGKIFKTTDKGANFQDIFTVTKPGQTVSSLLIQNGAPSTIIATDQLGSVYRSTDAGASWRRTFSVEPEITAITQTGQAIYLGTNGGGIWKSVDNGVTFAPVNNGLSASGQNVWALASGLGALYAGSDQGLLASRDEGASWQAIGNPLPPGNTRVQAIAVNNQYVFFAANAVVYQLAANGQFVPVQLKLAKSVYGLSIAPNASGTIYAAANNRASDYSERYGIGLQSLQLKPNR